MFGLGKNNETLGVDTLYVHKYYSHVVTMYTYLRMTTNKSTTGE